MYQKSEGGGRREKEGRKRGRESSTWFSKFKSFLFFNDITTFFLQSSKQSIINMQSMLS